MSSETRRAHIEAIRQLPAQIAKLVRDLDHEALSTPFLHGEWTIAQNVHHLFDSHANSYIRCKLIATEEHPPLKPYDQDAWAALPDASVGDVSVSLAGLHALHSRWAYFWETLPDASFARSGLHPERGAITLDFLLRVYAEHGLAHIDQITRTLAAR
ncbi:metal-dependent hydrolase [Candidatus Gracilibacteria bacterium]|nr:metal-dependent hydrolase [Candidatus Gracilibacteria bacterium]